VLVLAIGAPAAGQGGASTEMHLVDLGTLGGDYSQANALNDRGDIVGASNTTVQGDLHPVVWRGGHIIDLGMTGGLGTSARAVNNRGQVVGCVADGGANGNSHAVVWINS
jgi:probable HAF family extracellular repeat protein